MAKGKRTVKDMGVTVVNGKRMSSQIRRPDVKFVTAQTAKFNKFAEATAMGAARKAGVKYNAKSAKTVAAAQARSIDNRINKINKRMLALAKQGGYASEAYKAMAQQYELIMHRIKQAQGTYFGEADPTLTEHKYASPIEYADFTEQYQDQQGQWVNGTTYKLVPQLLRSKWVIAAITEAELQSLEAIQTAQAEATALETLLPNRDWMSNRPDAVSETVTTERIKDIMEENESHNDFLTDVWHYLYTIQHKYTEVAEFLNDCKGSNGTAARNSNNGKAIKMFNKYTGSKFEDTYRERPLTPAEVQKKDKLMAMSKAAYDQAQSPDQQTRAANQYLLAGSIAGSYTDPHGITMQQPDQTAISTLLDLWEE